MKTTKKLKEFLRRKDYESTHDIILKYAMVFIIGPISLITIFMILIESAYFILL